MANLLKRLFKGKQKPKTIEEQINEELTGDTQKNALDFAAFLKANDTLPGCLIVQPKGNPPNWTIFLGGYSCALCRDEYQDYPIDEDLKEFAWANVHHCRSCGCGYRPGRRVHLFGRAFDNVCTAVLGITNSEGEKLELAKRLSKVWMQCNAEAAKKAEAELQALGENEWPTLKDFGAHVGRPLGKTYTDSLKVSFYFKNRYRYADAAVAFSGGGWVPATWEQIPAALRIGGHFGHGYRFEACKGPKNKWTAEETLKYQANVTYFVDTAINIKKNTYSMLVWMLDAKGEKDTPYRIAVDYPFALGTGSPTIPKITAIDTIYLGPELGAIIIRDFKVVGGE